MKLWMTQLRKVNREQNNFRNQMANDAVKAVNSANWNWQYRMNGSAQYVKIAEWAPDEYPGELPARPGHPCEVDKVIVYKKVN